METEKAARRYLKVESIFFFDLFLFHLMYIVCDYDYDHYYFSEVLRLDLNVKASLEEQQPDDKDPKVVLSNTKCFVTYTTLGIVI